MYKRILVAVDGSDTSSRALLEAIKLAKEQGSEIRLVHVVDPAALHAFVEAPYNIDYQRMLEAAAQSIIDDCSATVREAGIKFETRTRGLEKRGQHVYDLIEEEGQLWSADLIVIGTHGRRGIRRWMLGSVAEGLTRTASRPVLLIPSSVGASLTPGKSA